jgi:hypothetical protein
MKIQGFDARSWHRLVTLVAPGLTSYAPESCERDARRKGGMLFVFYNTHGVVRALHSLRGAVTLAEWKSPSDLARCAESLETRFAFATELGALEELYERVGGRIADTDDPIALLLLVLGAARELAADGKLHLVPAPASGVPLPPPEVLRRVWDTLVPDGHAVVLAFFEGVELETSLVVRRRGGVIDLVLGPEILRRMVGPLGGDPRRDFRVVRAAVEREIAPVACGIYASTARVRELLASDAAGHWARAMATREIVVDPMPPWIAVAASAGAVRAVASHSRSVLSRVEVLGVFAPLAQRAREALGQIDLTGLLGFDPLDAISTILQRSQGTNVPDDSEEP